VPGAVANTWAEAARKGIKDDEETLERVNNAAIQFGRLTTGTSDVTQSGEIATGGISGGDIEKEARGRSGLAIAPLERERQDDVEHSFENAVRGLERLKKEMPAVVARMERARKAAEYVVTER
jgi:kinetochor protein Mis14/NSL1